jgi:hypothetical protein
MWFLLLRCRDVPPPRHKWFCHDLTFPPPNAHEVARIETAPLSWTAATWG